MGVPKKETEPLKSAFEKLHVRGYISKILLKFKVIYFYIFQGTAIFNEHLFF